MILRVNSIFCHSILNDATGELKLESSPIFRMILRRITARSCLRFRLDSTMYYWSRWFDQLMIKWSRWFVKSMVSLISSLCSKRSKLRRIAGWISFHEGQNAPFAIHSNNRDLARSVSCQWLTLPSTRSNKSQQVQGRARGQSDVTVTKRSVGIVTQRWRLSEGVRNDE